MAKNFDYILKLAEYVPGFKKLHDYCDKAESFQTTYPEESANNAARHWSANRQLRDNGLKGLVKKIHQVISATA